MKQRWNKIGQVFCPFGENEWMYSHASVPIAEQVDGDIYRIYFSSRNKYGQSYTGYLLIDVNRPLEILDISKTPVLAPGATWLSKHNGKRFLYYIGWNLGVTVPFRNSIGLAISENGADFHKYAEGPIVDRSMTEPHFTASCCVLSGQDMWRMWYLSCTDWIIRNGRPEHRYHIKYATSNDGISWKREGLIAIDYSNPAEYAISRPAVVRDNDGWKMWFSHRGSSYRIGYAESLDGVNWNRLDADCQINVSKSGWDSEMIEYPFVFKHNGRFYMLYNGNGYGLTGFGLAVLDEL